VTIVRVETLIDEAAARTPGKLALVFGDRGWTYGEVRAELDRRAALLVEAGLPPGAVVVAIAATSDDLTLTFLACCRANVTLLPLPLHLAAPELRAIVARAQPRLALLDAAQPERAIDLPPVLPLSLPGEPGSAASREATRRSAAGTIDDPGMLRTTSGTTQALPKLAIIPHRQLTWRREARAWWETPDGVYCKPQESTFGSFDICQVLAIGATLVQTHALAPDQLEADLLRHGITDLWTVPARLHPLAQSAQPPLAGLRLRSIRTASAALAPPLRAAIEARYRVPVVEQYGSTEASFVIATPRDAPPGSIGRPYPGVAIRLVDEEGRDVAEGAAGELILRAPGMMAGYLGDPGATGAILRDGWLHTGDLARRDADGCYSLEGRRAFWLNVGGRKVLPEEVERVLERHPGVREAVVLGLPDAARGVVVRAVIVPHSEPPAPAELVRFCRAHLAGYKVPRRIEFRDDLPRSPLGKVLRHQL
jgi:acyl-CoA synthetase (AMP-forming)/AMP-acid ligase II